MAVPKKRKSQSRSRMRRAHDALGPIYCIVCPNCGEATLPHRVCPSCGHYKGKKIIEVEEATE